MMESWWVEGALLLALIGLLAPIGLLALKIGLLLFLLNRRRSHEAIPFSARGSAMPTVRCPGCGRKIPVEEHELGAIVITCARCEQRFVP
jgi:hypothetical protein